MKKIITFFLIFVLTSSLALAVTVNTDKSDYKQGDIVTITISDCLGDSILRVINSDSELILVKQGEDSWNTLYNTASDSSKGKYSLNVNCEDGQAVKNFCVGADGCTASIITPAADTPPSSGGGGSRCTSEWSCTEWSYCNPELQQTRTCTDFKRCDYRNPTKVENKSCTKCDESWVCSLWSECRNGINTRNCADEHQCGTTTTKPTLQKSCTQTVPPGPAPGRTTSQQPTYTAPPAVQQPAAVVEPSLFAGLWEEYKTFIISIPLALILIIVIILVIHHFHSGKKMVHNVDELKEWVKKEKSMGTSDADIREILKEHTGWSEEEIDQAFK
ncbi:MAG: hypothetical protein ABIH82_01620 [Candidatus Woesearchaeota archaeon]